MHWDLRQARTFIAVAEALSFSAAARSLHTTQSAVSRTISEMERDLALPLLQRTTRSVSLTPEGRFLLDECREVVAHFDRWLGRAGRVADGALGQIAVGVNDFAIQAEVPRLLSRFRKRHPDIAFTFFSQTREDQFASLDNGEIDVGFAMGPIGRPHFSGFLVGDYGLNCLVHASHPFASRASIHLEDLRHEALILGDPSGWKTFGDYLHRAFGAAGVPLTINQMVSESVAIFGLVAAGSGVTLYPDCQDYVILRDVVKVPVTGLQEKIQTWAIWPDAHLPKTARLFIDFLKEEFPSPGGAKIDSRQA